MYPLAKRSLDWCIRTWDPNRQGALFEAHHNTYDIEFWGPDGMCTSFYLGALRAIAEMAKYLGNEADAKSYTELADRGMAYANKELFNGEYYDQKIMWTGLKTNLFDIPQWAASKGEVRELTEKEGPPFQYGKGCLADGVIGQWFAELFGLPDALDRARTRKHLESVFRYNFRRDLSEHVNPTRPSYALNDEAGLLMCTWPKGGRLSIPFFYAPEVWTGIEYQVASHMILEGLVDEGLTIVKAARDRYEGFKRNPWNEFECGSYYARALSVYGVLAALSGFRYSAVAKEVALDPRLGDPKVVSFFSTASAWGKVTIQRAKGKTTVVFEVEEGRLTIKDLVLPFAAKGKTGARGQDLRAGVSLPGGETDATCAISGGRARVALRKAVRVEPGKPFRVQIG
jgi:hypothetical protein